MTATNLSAFKPYSYGLVSENKPLSTNEILVIPVEITPFFGDEVDANMEDVTSKGKDSENKEYTVKIKRSTSIKCKWLKWGGNRITAPDVRVGMRVMIYRFGDSNLFYWTDLGLDNHLMRLETITWLFNDNPDGVSDEPSSPDNSISLTVSTHEKHITLQTVKTNSEKFAYTINLDLENSTFTITDDINNYIHLDSANNLIRAHNADTTFIELSKLDINLYAPGNYSLRADENISISCKNYLLEVEEDYTETIDGDYDSKVGGNYSIKCSTYTCDTKLATFTGMVAMGGMTTAPGAAAGNGGASMSGPVTMDSTLTAMKVTSTLPIDAPNV